MDLMDSGGLIVKLLGEYQNGNYTVKIFEDGTKIRETDGDMFIPAFPESIDMKITNQCDMGCPWCYENSRVDGKHAVIEIELIDSIHPFTELAIGGGNPLSHPQLIPFLTTLKSKNIIANITVNQNHFIFHQDLIKYLTNKDLIKGLGISLTKVTGEFINCVQQYPNAVIHVINGITSLNELRKLYNNNLKILILGYKEIRRGKNYYSPKIEVNKSKIYQNICEIIRGFKVVSFDNLAIEQLELKRIFTNKDWNRFYMGDDGQYTMYIDLVEQEFAVGSTSTNRFKLTKNVPDMFNIIRSLDKMKK